MNLVFAQLHSLQPCCIHLKFEDLFFAMHPMESRLPNQSERRESLPCASHTRYMNDQHTSIVFIASLRGKSKLTSFMTAKFHTYKRVAY